MLVPRNGANIFYGILLVCLIGASWINSPSYTIAWVLVAALIFLLLRWVISQRS
jgi:hypothetical protein